MIHHFMNFIMSVICTTLPGTNFIRTKMLLCNDFTITLKELQVREIA